MSKDPARIDIESTTVQQSDRHRAPSPASSQDEQLNSRTARPFAHLGHLSPEERRGQHVADLREEDSRDGSGKGRDSRFAQGSVVRLTDPAQALAFAQADETSILNATDVSLIAPEILIKIFSFLDPYSLSLSAAVCRSWALIARDDATWRAAFANDYGLESTEAFGQATAVPSLRRLAGTTWRSEYQQRSELLRRWRKSRAPTVLSTPRVDIINQISVSKQHTFMLSASQVYGVASRSNPFTGKVTKGYLDAEGTANGAGNGNPNIEFSPNVTALGMGADASSIAWGFRSGEVGLTSLSRQGVNPRGAIKSHQFSPRGAHAGPVSAVAVPFPSSRDGVHGAGRSPERLRQQVGSMGDVATTFATAGHDGTVRLWSQLRALPLWVASTAMRGGVSNAGPAVDLSAAPGSAAAKPITALDYDVRAGIIAAGNSDGKVVVWYNLDVAGLLSIRADAVDPPQLSNADVDEELVDAQKQLLSLVKDVRSVSIDLDVGSGAETSVAFLRIDADTQGKAGAAKDLSFSVLAHHSGAKVLMRHRISMPAVDMNTIYAGNPEPGRLEVNTTVFGAPLMSEITAVRPDFEPRGSPDKKTSVGPSPLVSTAASPVLAPSRSDSTNNVARLNIGPSPFTVVSGAGQFPEKKFVCVGTSSGSLHLFDYEADGSLYDETAQQEWQGLRPARFTGNTQVLPALSIQAHHTTITSLEITAINLIAGTSDGTIKVFCSLSGDLIRTINDRTATRHPARMLAAGELTSDEAARFRVQQIVADHDTLIAAIGHQVLAFKAEPILRAKDKKLAAAAKKAAGKPSSRTADSKFQLQIDLQRDLRESQAQLQAEREERHAQHRRMKSTVSDHGLGDMTEQEAFEYAMMLSKDEEEAKVKAESSRLSATSRASFSEASSSRHSGLSPADDPELADALEQIALAESRQQSEAPSRSSSRRPWSLEDHNPPEDFDMDDEASDLERYYARTSASPSPSPHASPYLGGVGSPSRAWTIVGQAGPSSRSTAVDRSHPESKLRTINVPRSARLPSASLSPTSAAAAGLREEWPAMSPPSFSAHSPLSPTYGRSLSSAASSLRDASPLDTPSKLGTSAASNSGSGTPFTSTTADGKKRSLGAWASGSPSLRPTHRPDAPPTHSLLSAQLGRSSEGSASPARSQWPSTTRSPQPAVTGNADQDMDEDLKFAIELSLAEERSRRDREEAAAASSSGRS